MPPTSPELTRKPAVAVGIWTALTLVAVLLWSRRLAGTFPGPLPIGWIIAWTTLVIAGSATAARLFPADRSQIIAAGVAFFASLAGLPGMSAASFGVFLGLWCVGGLILGAHAAGESLWTPFLAASTTPEPSSTIAPLPCSVATPFEELDETESDDAALQTMARRMTDDGEVIEGSVRVSLPPGEREATVHVSFCPPLATAPTVELEDVDGHGWDLKVAAAYPFGLRLQVRRGRECAEAVSGRIAYWAASTASSRAA